MYWNKLDSEQIKQRVLSALGKNTSYRKSPVMGIPATYLDPEIFYPDAPFLDDAPFLSTLVANPNHIGCHTLSHTEKIFSGTQELEKEVIAICAEQIFGGEKGKQDGYVCSGGTEGNIEALWIYRNHFRDTCLAQSSEIGVVYSEDSHYSIAKAIDLLGLIPVKIPVNKKNRQMDALEIEARVLKQVEKGVKYFIGIVNMSTTMFGSVDEVEVMASCFVKHLLPFRIHVDAAFGGFIYPFSNPGNPIGFKNRHVTSVSIDGHKLLQTPYGTGIFLIRKGYMQYVRTPEAQYVPGTDHTLCGSRSGANAVAIWMVLHNYGSQGWTSKIRRLVDFTNDICARLDQTGIKYYRHPFMNIVAMQADTLPDAIAEKYCLVADTYEDQARWWKMVVMPHVTPEMINAFFEDIHQYGITLTEYANAR